MLQVCYAHALATKDQALPLGYDLGNFTWQITLSRSGRWDKTLHSLKRLVPDKDKNGKPTTREVATPFPVPEIERSSDVTPNLITDDLEYVLGLALKDTKLHRLPAQHAAYIALVAECAEKTGHPLVATWLKFLERFDPATLTVPKGAARKERVMVEVGGVRLTDLPEVQQFWAERVLAANNKGAMQGYCQLTGNYGPLARLVPSEIPLVKGKLISYNQPAFNSARLSQGYNASVSYEAAWRANEFLRRMARDPARRFWLGDQWAVFFPALVEGKMPETTPGTDQLTEALVPKRAAEDVFRPMDALEQAQAPDVYVAFFAGGEGRAAIREWGRFSQHALLERTLAWRAAQAIWDHTGKRRLFPIHLLALGLKGDNEQDPKRPEAAAPVIRKRLRPLLDVAWFGQPLSEAALRLTLDHCWAAREISPVRFSLLKIALTTRLPFDQWREEGEALMSLNPERPEPAYHCGRIMAVLEEVQYAAVGAVQRTVTSQFLGAAAEEPRRVLTDLMFQAEQAHFTKLMRSESTRGAGIHLKRRLQEIVDRLDTLPERLDETGQALYALGFTHQRSHDWKKVKPKNPAGDSGDAAASDTNAAKTGADTNDTNAIDPTTEKE